jgi:DMSO/TMAO reductase YedYZ molybdopterin-dependent catalytic subunit
VGWQLIERAAAAVAAPGSRLVTGSKHAGSFSGNAYPITIWLFDPVPQLDAASWRLELGGRLAAPRVVSYADLRAGFAERQLQAVLDCTSGWWSEQVWTGVGLLDVLAAAGLSETAREVTVESVTGHHYTFPLADLTEALLVTHVGGEPLTPGHGFPVRLAVPGRRGYQWVKWVARVDVA